MLANQVVGLNLNHVNDYNKSDKNFDFENIRCYIRKCEQLRNIGAIAKVLEELKADGLILLKFVFIISKSKIKSGNFTSTCKEPTPSLRFLRDTMKT